MVEPPAGGAGGAAAGGAAVKGKSSVEEWWAAHKMDFHLCLKELTDMGFFKKGKACNGKQCFCCKKDMKKTIQPTKAAFFFTVVAPGGEACTDEQGAEIVVDPDEGDEVMCNTCYTDGRLTTSFVQAQTKRPRRRH